MNRVFVCRYGELFLKSGNRRRFERVLADNMRAILRDLPDARVEPTHGRVLVRVPEGATDDAATRLSRVFGLVSLSSARELPIAPLGGEGTGEADVEAIAVAAVDEARAAIERDRPASFKVEARRGDKRFPINSMEMARQIGARVAAATGLRVDVHTPDLRLGIQVTDRRAFVHAGTLPAPGGLPVGASGRALLLLSGGIDSPVAGWLAAKRGLALDAVYFHSPPYIGEKSRDKVMTLARQLARYQAVRSVTVVPFTDTQKQIRDAGPAELAVVLYRRMMMRIADAIADRLEAVALVTGENLGQVASQTIDNLTTIEAAARRLVLRPLVTYDKVETMALARRIGTFETSILPFEDCCSLFVPPHPATAARPADAERAEAQRDLGAEIAAAVAGSEKIDVA
jgi:thiamine biosynthesis protein ThiI